MTVFDTDNIKFLYGTSPYTEYQMEYDPLIYYWYEHIQEEIPLGSGLSKFYHRGYKIHFNLVFEENSFIKDDQYDNLRTVFNSHANMIINPAPVSASGASFGVYWTGDFNFKLVEGMTPFGYSGNIELVGTSVLSEIPSNFTLGSI